MDRASAITIMNKIHGCLAKPYDFGAERVVVDSLMNIEGWIYTEKAKLIFEDVVELVRALPKQFHETGHGGGWTFSNIATFGDEHGGIREVWGSDNHAGALVLICEYYGIVQDTLKTLGFASSSLNDTHDNVSYFLFNVQPHFLDLVRRNLGISAGVVIA